MFQKITVVLTGLLICSCCFAADGLPDPNSWFIQPLGWNALFHEKLQVSDNYVVWEADYGGSDGTYFYDGAGIYQPHSTKLTEACFERTRKNSVLKPQFQSI